MKELLRPGRGALYEGVQGFALLGQRGHRFFMAGLVLVFSGTCGFLHEPQSPANQGGLNQANPDLSECNP